MKPPTNWKSFGKNAQRNETKLTSSCSHKPFTTANIHLLWNFDLIDGDSTSRAKET